MCLGAHRLALDFPPPPSSGLFPAADFSALHSYKRDGDVGSRESASQQGPPIYGGKEKKVWREVREGTLCESRGTWPSWQGASTAVTDPSTRYGQARGYKPAHPALSGDRKTKFMVILATW